MDVKLLQEFKQQLGREQARLRALLASVAKEGRIEPVFENMDTDEEANQDEVEAFMTNIGTQQELEPQLLRVEHALEKIERGEYGVCEKCGADISIERLHVAPEAEYCTEHAE